MKTFTKAQIRAALTRVRDGLRSGLYIEPPKLGRFGELAPRGKRYFDMTVTARTYPSCGTIGCIGGWMGFELGARNARCAVEIMEVLSCKDHALWVLFYLFGRRMDVENKPPSLKVCANAIDRYLDGRKPW